MIALDTTQIATLAEGWGFQQEDTEVAVQIADSAGIPLVDFVGALDEIVTELRKNGVNEDTNPNFSASYITQCAIRAAMGLPLG